MIGKFERDGNVFCGEITGNSVASTEGTYDLSELRVLSPTNPSKIICIGLNYFDHARELELEAPERPLLFLKPPSSVIGPKESIVYPASSAHVDYEGELAVIIGQRCRRVQDPEKVILGYTCFNDITARDLQVLDGQWTRSKSYDTFAPLGPYIATDLDSLHLSIVTRVNGRIKQDSNVSNLIFDVNYLIKFISHIMTLEAGDIIATGTPAGVGPLKPGDTVEVTIQHIGTLMNNVISQQDDSSLPCV
ncbi:MAG: fumarylacetoacetate hydrolase family protein [Euryarchaeota archaeon]|nr:fumarylacetoacetate hydrolase family protein [Euryarchaeota archaeon]